MDTTNTAEDPTAPGGPQAGDIIRGKWLYEGATTLAEAADRLEAEAAQLRSLHEQGWTLEGPVADDYGFLVDPKGNAGRHEEDDL